MGSDFDELIVKLKKDYTDMGFKNYRAIILSTLPIAIISACYFVYSASTTNWTFFSFVRFFLIATILIIVLVTLLYSIFNLLTYRIGFNNFCKKLNALDAEAKERLIKEYGEKRRVNVYRDRRKRIVSEFFYTTENFLIDPGVDIIARDTVEELRLFKNMSYRICVLKLNTREERQASSHKKVLRFSVPRRLELELFEEITAWLWKEDISDPKHHYRTQAWYEGQKNNTLDSYYKYMRDE